MDNKATTKRMIGAVVLVLVAALLLAWLLKGKNRDNQQLAVNQPTESRPILGFPGVTNDEQKPSLLNGDAQPTGSTTQTAVPPTADQNAPATDFAVRPPQGQATTTQATNEVRRVVDTDGKVKTAEGNIGTGETVPIAIPPQQTAANGQTPVENKAGAGSTMTTTTTTTTTKAVSGSATTVAHAPNHSMQDQAANKVPPPPAPVITEKKTSNVVLVNEKAVPKNDNAAAEAHRAAADRAAAEKAAAAKAAEQASAEKAATEKAAAEKSKQLAAAKAAEHSANAAAAKATEHSANAAGKFVIQVMASSDKATADAVAQPLQADGNTVAVVEGKVEGKTIYRVRLGGFNSREAAAAAQAKMKSRYAQNQYVQNSFVTQ